MKVFFRFIKVIFKYLLRKLGITKNVKYFEEKFPNIKFDKQWYDKYLSNIDIYSCKLKRVKLKDLRCRIIRDDGNWYNVPLNQSPMYKYLLSGDKQAYKNYHEAVDRISKEYVHTCDNYEHLVNKLEKIGYDKNNPICVKRNNEIIDGQHRASYLLKKYGEDYEITVFKIYYL